MNNDTPQLPTPPFENPYDTSKMPKGETKTRTTIDIFTEAHALILGVHGRKGTIQTTINILLSKFINELKRNGIDSYDPNGYERAAAGVIVIAGGTTDAAAVNDLLTSLRAGRSVDPGVPAGSTERPADAPAVGEHDGRATGSLPRGTVGEHVQPPDVGGNRPRRRSRSKGSK